jgi:glucose-1-phosphate adenylyltransferase
VAASVLTLILAGGEGERLSILSQVRAKPGVPFGGKYRIIDFALSNTVNSGFADVGILTQYAPRSLMDHIGVGRPWDLDRSRGGVTLLQPFIGRGRARDWYRGTADAVLQNLDFLSGRRPELVLVLAGDHIYKMDYRPFIDLHLRRGADVTVAVRTVPIEEAHRFGILDVDADDRVTAFVEKPARPLSNLVSMGVYVFSWPALRAALSPSRIDFGRDVLPGMIAEGRRVAAYRFDGYWEDVGTVETYWRANLDLLRPEPGIDLYDRDWLIYTRSEERAPALIGAEARVTSSLVSHGCVVEGTVIDSVLSPGVHVGRGAIVRESIVMFDTEIGPDAVVDRAIIDKECLVGGGAQIGAGDELRPNRSEPERLYAGLTLVGKQARIPGRVTIGRNCRIDPGVNGTDFGRRRRIPSGETVLHAGV